MTEQQNKGRSCIMNKILIIDDDRELCALIKRSVQAENIEADFCNTGKEGLQKLREQEYQLVVLDVMMPGMDGFETLEEIRKENSLPILMFTGLQDEDEGIMLPKSVTKGRIIKTVLPEGQKRYDFQFVNKRGYKITVEGLSEKFNPEYWNYAKLISGVLRYRMPVAHVIKLVNQLQLTSETLNTWRVGVERALKKYLYEENGIDNLENGIDYKETEDEIDEQ